MKTITDASFDTDVVNNPKPVLVDFWAPWCGPCKQIAPILNTIAADTPNVDFTKLNVDENPASPSKFGIRGIPALILFSGGTPAATLVGAQTEQAIRKWIAEATQSL